MMHQPVEGDPLAGRRPQFYRESAQALRQTNDSALATAKVDYVDPTAPLSELRAPGQSTQAPAPTKTATRKSASGTFNLLYLVRSVSDIASRVKNFEAPTSAERIRIGAISLLEFGWHLSHPKNIMVRLRILASGFREDKKLSEAVRKGEEISPSRVQYFLQGTMGRSYFLGILAAVSCAGVAGSLTQQALKNPVAGMLTAIGVDYLVQLATCSASFMWGHRHYFFDGKHKDVAQQRRQQFKKVMFSDFAASCLVYGFTFLATKATVSLLPVLEPASSTFVAFANFGLFATVALGNVMVGAKFMTPAYYSYLMDKFGKKPLKAEPQQSDSGSLTLTPPSLPTAH